jgi:hypothetical protein
MIESVKSSFEECFIKVNHAPEYELRLSPQTKKQIQNFLSLLNKRMDSYLITEEFIFLFIVFQFNYKYDQKSRYGNRLPLNHIIGKEALKRWERKAHNWLYWVDKFIETHNITRPVKKAILINHSELVESEERIKEMHKNSPDLLFFCCEMTTLFHPISELCRQCDFQGECIELLKQIYPDIYEARKR